MEITTTLNRISAHETCAPVLEKLLTQLGKTQADDEPLRFSTILDCSGLDDALLCCQAEPQHDKLWWHFAAVCIESVKHLMGSRSRDILPIEWRWVTTEERLAERTPFLGLDIAEGVGRKDSSPNLMGRARDAIQAAKLTTFMVDFKNDPAESAHARACEAAVIAAWQMSCNEYGIAASSAVKAIETIKVRTKMTKHFRRIVTAGWVPIIVKGQI